MMSAKSTRNIEVSNQTYCYSGARRKTKDTYRLTFVAEGAAKTSVTPKGLRIIDIIFKAIGAEDSTRQRLKDGDLAGDLGMTVEYYGFRE